MELLYELCAQIEDIPRKDGAGRNRIPLSDMVFSVVFKTYSGISGRRFISDLQDAKQKGFITQIPHFNSLFNYLEMEDVFYILKDLIRESASPLRAVEMDFAVDSSGFSTGTTVRWLHAKYSNPHIIDKADWLKCHLICGVLTNIVTSVEITEGTAADHAFFKPLVQRTAQDFKLNHVRLTKHICRQRTVALSPTEAARLLFRSKKTADQTTLQKMSCGERCITFFRCADRSL